MGKYFQFSKHLQNIVGFSCSGRDFCHRLSGTLNQNQVNKCVLSPNYIRSTGIKTDNTKYESMAISISPHDTEMEGPEEILMSEAKFKKQMIWD